jgi:hypothetical protein
MNTANLQLEGLVMAVAAITEALIAKGALSRDEVDHSLAVCEQTALGDERISEDLSPANRDAVVFPIRLLRLANTMAADQGLPAFAELARRVGETKGPHNDQR